MADDRIARGFSDMAEVYVDLTGPGKRLLETAHLRSAERVLDVGCGPGIMALAAARLVGDAGRVLAIDLAPGMLARAREATRDEGIVDVLAMDARRLGFRPGSFDVVLASSVVQFTGPHSMMEWKRVLAPGGRLACSRPHGPAAWFELCRAFVGRTREPFRSEMTARLARALVPPDGEAARQWLGFDSVVAHTESVVRRYRSGEEAFADEYRHGARIFLEELPPEALAAFKAAYFEAVTANGAVEIPFEFHYWCFQ